jgi:HlyD family secretion protein
LKKPRRKRWIILAALLASVAGAAAFPVLRGKRPQRVRLAPVERVPELRQVVNGSGEIRTEDSIDIQAEIAGVIIEIPVREGDRVQKGQVLLRIDPFQTQADVESARSQFSALEAEAAGQNFQVASAEANKARDEFLKKSAEVELRQAQTNLARARAAARREKQLLDDNLISPDQYEVTETQLKLNEAEEEAALAKIEQLEAQIKAAAAQIEFARTSRDAVLRRVEGAKSSLLRAEDLLQKTTIRSTIDGVIVALNVEEGERAVPGILSNPQATLMTIADFSVIEAELKIDETDIVSVKLEDRAKVVVDALAETPLEGVVVEIGNSPILSASGAGPGAGAEGKDFKVVVRIAAPPESLRPGMSCEADITTAVKQDVVVVPIQALTAREVVVDADGRYVPERAGSEPGFGRAASAVAPPGKLAELQGVFVLGDGKLARFRPVKTGISGEMDVEVLEGLAMGDSVIVGPLKALRTLKDGERVEIDAEHPFRRSLRPRAEDDAEAGERP